MLLAGAAYEVWVQDWSGLFVVAQALVLSVIPYVLAYRYHIVTSAIFRLSIVAFMFATLFLGEVQHFYVRYPWWDAVLHACAGAGLTFFGFMLLSLMHERSELRSTTFLIAFSAFSISMTGAVLWEVYEFFVDALIGPDPAMQPSNTDTMTDLVAAIIGGAVVSVWGFCYLWYRKRNVGVEMIEGR